MAHLESTNITVTVDYCPPGFNFRVNWRGKLILQKLHKSRVIDHYSPGMFRNHEKWNDATVPDLNEFFTSKAQK